jgi:glycogen debranching enzyme
MACCLDKRFLNKGKDMSLHIYKNPIPFTKDGIPEPVFEQDPSLVDFYWTAWESAWNHILKNPGAPQSPYIDEGFNPDIIWIWDTCFMVHFCKYAPVKFPGIESFQNFYAPFHENASTSLKIQHVDNPPLFAWIEYEYFKITGDKSHLKRIFKEKQYLQKHFEFCEKIKQGNPPPYGICQTALEKTPYGYQWSGTPSGMDNTPRGRGKYDSILWIDALAQQALSAIYIAKIAKILDDNPTEQKFKEHYKRLKALINDKYWNNEDGIYYDILKDDPDTQIKVKSIASFWPMLAEACDQQQAEALAEQLKDPKLFGGDIPFPTVTRDDPDYIKEGKYWRGGVWIPTAYMTIKGLEKYGYQELADKTSFDLLRHMHKTYNEYSPHTIWEAYNPEEAKPASNGLDKIVRPDFCGWSALGPISLFIENVLGFHNIDAQNKRIKWRKHQNGRHGIKNLKFGSIETDIIANGDEIEVTSNEDYTLVINQQEFAVKAGNQIIEA